MDEEYFEVLSIPELENGSVTTESDQDEFTDDFFETREFKYKFLERFQRILILNFFWTVRESVAFVEKQNSSEKVEEGPIDLDESMEEDQDSSDTPFESSDSEEEDPKNPKPSDSENQENT